MARSKGRNASPLCARTLPKVFVEHLLPTRRVEAGGVGYYTVEIKKDGVVLVAVDALALWAAA